MNLIKARVICAPLTFGFSYALAQCLYLTNDTYPGGSDRQEQNKACLQKDYGDLENKLNAAHQRIRT